LFQVFTRNWGRWFLGLVLGVLFVWFATSDWQWEHIFGHTIHLEGWHLMGGDLAGIQPSAIASGHLPLPVNAWTVHLPGMLPYVLILVMIHFIRAWRWSPLLKRLGHKVPFRVLNNTGGISFAAIFLFPLRLGEFVRPALLARQSTVTISESMALVVLERIFDGLAVTLILLAVLIMLPEGANPEAYHRLYIGTWISLAVFGGGLLFIIIAYIYRRQTEALIGRTVGRFSESGARRVRDILSRFNSGLSCMPDFKTMLIFSGTTMGYWLLNGLGYFAMIRAFGFHMDPIVGYAMMAAVVIGMMIPNSPANVGTFWYFLLLPLAVYGESALSVQAIVFALFVWFLQMFQMAVFGLYFLARTPVRMSELKRTREEPENASPTITKTLRTSSERP
jgi:hypothetical protein